ncbi:MAG: translation initiation factor IF-2 [Spirochaetaceae bacterium]
MAEEHDKDQKPRTTLIKHRKDKAAEGRSAQKDPAPQEEGSEKKKVRVVVRRKTKADANKESGAEQTERPQRESTSLRDRQTETHPPQPRRAVGQEETPSAGAGEAAGKGPGEGEQRQGGERQIRWQNGAPQGGPRKEKPKAPEVPAREMRSRREPEPRKGPPSGGQRRGPVPPATGGRPGAGAPEAPSTPGEGAPGAAGKDDKRGDRRGAHRKFYKSKKKEPTRREKFEEKQVQYKQRKAAPKANPVPKSIDIMEVVTVSELARKMNLKASDLISKLMGMGMMVTINQQIDAETAEILAGEYGCQVNIVSLYDETIIETEQDKKDRLKTRPPVVTVMGHVDHGKTKLLDAIRSEDVVAGEFGGITQHIGAYQVELPDDQGRVTFLDTPGHEAFTLMRARGAQITDVVVLVVAADDGVMPQTREAVDHAKEADVPIIVAINKMDLPDANPDRVKQQLSELDLIPEEWGGNTMFVPVSAMTHDGIESLLEGILLQAEILELEADYDVNAEGTVLESKIDPGRGTVATVLIRRGTLKVGDNFVSGVFPGRVRAMFNDRGERVEEASPSMPVEILGLGGIPNAGDPFQVTESEKQARQVGDKRQELRKVEEAKNVRKITLDNLYDSIQEGAVQELKVVIKGDVHGSVEALQNALEKLSTSEIRLSVIHASAGAIHEQDVMLASASNAIIVGFHVRPTPRAQELAEREKVEVRKYNVIYDVVDDIRAAMEGLLAPELREETIGEVEVRETFKVPKVGVIAGSYVRSGKVRRNAQAHVIRDGVEVYTGKVESLKRFKEDAREVESGYECGIGIENFNDIRVGDVIEVFEIRKVAKTLEGTRRSS